MVDWKIISGLSDYNKMQVLMEETVQRVINYTSNEIIYLLEHNHTYTAGTNFKTEELLDAKQIPVYYTGRGGKFTYHGPGQIVIYPILDLRKENRTQDIKLYVKNLEQWIINSLARFGVEAFTIKNKVGIWVNDNNTQAKIGAIGIRIKKWVTYHGIAVNINTDLSKFSGIIPCGIKDFPVTSLHKLGIRASVSDFSSILKEEFEKIFG